MFRSSKPLIGTPRNQRKGGNNLEFTPIGQENHNNCYTSRKNTTIKKSQAIDDLIFGQKRNPLDNSPLINRVHGGSSFFEENSYDTIHHSTNKADQERTTSPIMDDFNNHDLLNNGSNPVKLQGEAMENLQKENTGLKIQITSLKRQLDLLANNEQLKLYEENSKLQEKLIEYKGEINTLANELHYAKNKEPEVAKSHEIEEKHNAEIRTLNSTIKAITEAKEKQEDLYRTKIRELEDFVGHLEKESRVESVSHEQVDKLEQKVEGLQDLLEEKINQICRKDEELDEREEQIEELKAKVKEIQQRSQQRSEISNAVGDQVEELKFLVQQKDEKCVQLEQENRKKDHDLSTFKNDLKKARDLIAAKEHKNDLLENSLKSSKKKIMVLQDELEKTKDNGNSRAEIRRLKEHNISLESKIDQLKFKLVESNEIIQEQKQLLLELEQSEADKDEIERIKQDYTKKFQYLEKQNHNLASKCDFLQRELDDYDTKHSDLNLEYQKIQKNYNELKRNLQSTTKSADLNQTLENQVNELVNQIDDLNLKNNKLQRDLKNEKQMKKSTTESYVQMELESLSFQNNQLQTDLQNKKHELDQIRLQLSSKDHEILQLRNKLQEMEITRDQGMTKERLELLSSKNELKYELKALKLEMDSLKKVHETEAKSLQKTIEMLQQKERKDFDQRKDFFKVVDNDDVYEKINDKNTKIRYLHDKLDEFKSKIKQDEKKIIKLEDDKSELYRLNKELEKELNKLEDQNLKFEQKLLKLSQLQESSNETDVLKLELRSKEKEINILNREFNEMKQYLIEKYHVASNERIALQGKVDKITLKYRQSQQANNNPVSKKKLSYLEDQTELYRMKFIQSQYKISDLKFINSFMIKSIQATNSHLKKDIRKLQNVGIYPDYEIIRKKQLKLKVLFKFVAAAVRIKRKTTNSAYRNKRLEKLTTKIELLDY